MWRKVIRFHSSRNWPTLPLINSSRRSLLPMLELLRKYIIRRKTCVKLANCYWKYKWLTPKGRRIRLWKLRHLLRLPKLPNLKKRRNRLKNKNRVMFWQHLMCEGWSKRKNWISIKLKVQEQEAEFLKLMS